MILPTALLITHPSYNLPDSLFIINYPSLILIQKFSISHSPLHFHLFFYRNPNRKLPNPPTISTHSLITHISLTPLIHLNYPLYSYTFTTYNFHLHITHQINLASINLIFPISPTLFPSYIPPLPHLSRHLIFTLTILISNHHSITYQFYSIFPYSTQSENYLSPISHILTIPNPYLVFHHMQ